MDDSPKISPELIQALMDECLVKVGGGVKKDSSIAGTVTLIALDFIEPMRNGIQDALNLIEDANPEFEIGVVNTVNPCLGNERLSFQFRNPAAYLEV